MKKNNTIIYVNFSPYDNAGRILDFLRDNFSEVIHFSFDHLRLENGRKTNILTVYRNGIAVNTQTMTPIRTPKILRFPSLPIVAFLIFVQTYWWSRKILGRNRADYYLSVNAYTAWVGNFLRYTGLTKKTIFWVWDYFPPGFPDVRIQFMRWIYWKFDKPGLNNSDIITCIGENLIKLRFRLGSLSSKRKYTVIPIGTNPIKTVPQRPKQIIGFLGMLKTSQGLDFIFDSIPKIHKKYPRIRFEIIGSGPEESVFVRRATKWKKFVTFYGHVESEDRIDTIMKRWSIGLATYLPVSSNESYWSDPSKIKAYISQAIPVITTNVSPISREIIKYDAGIVVPYGNTDKFLWAIGNILSKKKVYTKNAKVLAEKYYYKRLYRRFFTAK